MNSNKPLLSIGIIFRDDIRCIEHCLKCLQALRDAVPCELVMADTGSVDGSREIAEKYADQVFDFPWIKDFAAARNAVMDRCCGEWYFSVDTDEYLREDVSELKDFLYQAPPETLCAFVVVRNYNNYELIGRYSDLLGARLARLTDTIRFHGAVHETFEFGQGTVPGTALNHTILDHDGYAGYGSDSERSRKKLRRNLELIRGELEKEPDNLLLHMQLLESGFAEPDYVDQVRRAVELVEQKAEYWDRIGPPILRYAVSAANERKLPERDRWLRMAEEWFPESMYTRLDVEWSMLTKSWDKGDFDDCVTRGERFLTAMADFNAGADPMARMYGTLQNASPVQEQRVKILLAYAYCCCTQRNTTRAAELLGHLDYTLFDAQQTAEMIKSLHELQLKSDLDTSGLISAAWEGISAPLPSQKEADQRKQVFMQTADLAFVPENQKKEQEQSGFARHAYTLYLPLRGKCEVGAAAAVLEEGAPEMIESILAEVEDWTLFPAPALAYALEHGVRFPLPDKPLNIEIMDVLAGRLAADRERFLPIVKYSARNPSGDDVQGLMWLRALALAAVKVFPWASKEPDEENGLTLARIFAQMDKMFLPLCYSREALTEKRLFLLPPMHRFGFYCSQAFDALDAGDRAGYVRLLREGLAVSEGMKPMVEFLLEHTPELQTPPEPSAELKALADQIRAVLANFSPDDPAVVALKQSEAYQKVAYLIEGMEVPVVGGLKQ